MSKQLEYMKRQVAGKMGGGRKSHGLSCPHCHGYHTTKAGAQEYFTAKVNKKKLPFHTKDMPPETKKDQKYAKVPRGGKSIDKFLKKYPEWDI